MPNTYKQVFKAQRKLLEAAPAEARNKAGVMFASRVVPRTPVDTGRARANWRVDVGATPSMQSTLDLDPAGTKTPAKIRAEIKAAPKTGKMFISNWVIYINRLNNGWSKQAPAGFVQSVAQEVSVFASKFLALALGARVTGARPLD